MPVTETPTPAPAPTPTVASKADVRKRKALVDEFKAVLNDAQAELTKAFADLKAVVDAGDEVASLTPLMAAVDNMTAAVGNITAHGARNSHLSNDDSKKLRDAQNALTQAFSDLRTALEFPSMATDLAGLSLTVDNMAAAVSGVGSAKP